MPAETKLPLEVLLSVGKEVDGRAGRGEFEQNKTSHAPFAGILAIQTTLSHCPHCRATRMTQFRLLISSDLSQVLHDDRAIE